MFYQRLLDLCSARNLKITNLVPVWGISSGNLSKWKSGGVPRGDTLCKIADYFGVSTDYLLGRTEVRELARSEADPLLASILSHYSGFNQEGREKLADLADDLAASGKYIKTGSPALVDRKA